MTRWRPAWLRTDPARWAPGTLDRAALFEQVRALAARPGFDQVGQRFALCWLRTQETHPELRAVFRNTPRYLLLVASLVLHHRRDPAVPGSGVTPGNLLRFFGDTASHAVSTSPGQVKAMLAHARLHGLLHQPAADPHRVVDSRLRVLAPSPRLQGIMKAWVQGFLATMEGVPELPLPDDGLEALTTPEGVAGMFAFRMAALNIERFVLWEGLEGLDWVLAHDHGYRLMLNLVRAAGPAPDGRRPLRITVSELAAAVGASRSHVRNVLADAQAQRWFVQEGPRSPLCFEPAAWDLAMHWIARELVWMHGLLLAAEPQRDSRPAECRPGA